MQYCSIPDRTSKPFNPLLGETFEYVTKDFKFCAEQVSHHPPITACHAYGKGYEMWTHSEMKSKFGGNSLEFTPLGKAYYVIGDEHYVGTRPKTVAGNIIFGTLYLDLSGDTETVCPQIGVKCVLKHHPKGWTNKNDFLVEGHVFNSDGEKTYSVRGHWNQSISATNLETDEEILLWEIEPRAENFAEQYGLTKFAINLNHLPPKLEKKIAPTDSRFRPDLRAYENGDIDLGAKEKHRLEEKQREVRKIRNENNETWNPLFFEEVVDEDTGDRFFKFNDNYWLKRAKGSWSDSPDIY